MFKKKFWRIRKKRHYRSKFWLKWGMIWDLEFLIRSLESSKEGYRVEYDRINEIIAAALVRITEEKGKEKPDKELMDSLQRLIDKHQPDADQLKKQMIAIDEEDPKVNIKMVKKAISSSYHVLDELKDTIKKI